MRKISTFLSIILTLIMVVSIIPMSNITSNAVTYSGVCGENLAWEFDNNTNVLTIYGSGEMDDFFYGTPWDLYASSIEYVSIQYGVTSISNDAFSDCEAIREVSIPDSVKTINSFVFFNCDNLRKVVIPDSVSHIGYHVFASCDNLETVTIGCGLTRINRNSFEGCENLKEVYISSSVTEVEDSAFYRCNNLSNVYYNGTKEQWNLIAFNSYNDNLINANVHFVEAIELSILEPSINTIRYNDGIVLHTNIEGELPQGAIIVWTANNNNFKISDSADSTELTAISKKDGYTIFTATIYDTEGNEISKDSVELYSKAGFFDIIGGLFRTLFGTTKIYDK